MDKGKRAEYMRDYRLRRREKWAENQAAVDFIRNRHPELWAEWMAYSSGSGKQQEPTENPIADLAIMISQLAGAVDMLASLSMLERAEVDQIAGDERWGDEDDTPATRENIYNLLRPADVYRRRAKAFRWLRNWTDDLERYISENYGSESPVFYDDRNAIRAELAGHTGDAIII